MTRSDEHRTVRIACLKLETEVWDPQANLSLSWSR